MNPTRRNKKRKMYTLDEETLKLLEQMAKLFFGGNASATVEKAIQELAKQRGLAMTLMAAMKRRRRRTSAMEDQAGPVMALEDVFWSLLAWGRETFGDEFFEATYAVDPSRGPHGTFSWIFSFDLAAYERLRGQGPKVEPSEKETAEGPKPEETGGDDER